MSILSDPTTSTATLVGLAGEPAWARLKDAVERLRVLQSADGSIDRTAHDPTAAAVLVEEVVAGVEALAPELPHDAAYLARLVADLRRWADGGFGVPDFLDSLLAFQPAS